MSFFVRILVTLGLFFLVLAVGTAPWRPAADFAGFYTGAKLANTGDLYSLNHAAELGASINAGHTAAFVRLPFYAQVLRPLGLLSYRAAFVTFEMLGMLALAGAVYLSASPAIALAIMATTIPLWFAVSIGQDVLIVLLVFFASLRLLNARSEFTAGVVLSVCLLLKPNIFAPIVIVVLAKKLWRLGAGLVGGALALIAISFATAGPHWIASYLALLRLNESQIPFASRRSLAGLLQMVPFGNLWIVLASAAVLIALFWAALKLPLQVSLAAALFAGLLVGVHSYLSDCAYIIPLAVLAGIRTSADRAVLLNLAFGIASRFASFPYPVKPLAYAVQLIAVLLIVRAAAPSASVEGLRSQFEVG